MSETMTYTGQLVVETCYKCHIPFAMPADFKQQALNDHSISFWCPRGHGQHYIGQSVEASLRRQLEWANRSTEEARADAKRNDYRARAAKAKLTRLRRRLANGICPCCNQPFPDIAEHLQREHPGFSFEESESEVPQLPA